MTSWNIAMPDAEWCTAEMPEKVTELVNELRQMKRVAIDTETTGLRFMTDIPLYWSLSWRRANGEARRACLRADALHFFREIFQDPERDWEFVNAKYDTHILYNVGIRLAGRLNDVSVRHALLYEEDSHSLKDMSGQILGWRWMSFEDTFGKIDKSSPNFLQDTLIRCEHTDRQKLVEYASNDAYGTLVLAETLDKELEEAEILSLYPDMYPNLYQYFKRLEVPFTKALWKCERNGNYVDTDYLKNIEDPVRKEIDSINIELNQRVRALLATTEETLKKKMLTMMVGGVFNPNSPKQLQVLFFDVKGYKPLKMTNGGKSGVRQPSVDSDFLESIRHVDKEAEIILRNREITKLYGTYVIGLQDARDMHGRVHTKYNADVARTGRLSSSQPNLQNIPRPDGDKFGIRRAFIPEEGNILVVADYEQLEMRLLAAAAGEQDMIDIFLKGIDIHMGNASFVYGIPYEDMEKAKKTEKKVKASELPESAMTDYFKKCMQARQEVKAIGFGQPMSQAEVKPHQNGELFAARAA